jgi:ribosomal protein S27AE
MNKQRRALQCARCAVGLVSEFDLLGDASLQVDDSITDQRYVCPRCGAMRPVVYVVERSTGSEARRL